MGKFSLARKFMVRVVVKGYLQNPVSFVWGFIYPICKAIGAFPLLEKTPLVFLGTNAAVRGLVAGKGFSGIHKAIDTRHTFGYR